MTGATLSFSILTFSLSLSAGAQVTGFVSGAAYSRPSPPLAAPGQLTNFFVFGLKGNPDASASTVPLPASLAGVSAVLRQATGTSPMTVPILAIHPFIPCTVSVFSGAICVAESLVTVQIPFELVGTVPGSLSPPGLADITFVQNGSAAASLDLTAVTDSIHVLTDCDELVPAGTSAPNGLCNPLVTHADGSRLLGKAAVAGETLVIYALGLGAVSPQPADGAASAGAAAVAHPISLNLNWSANAQALRLPYPYLTPPSTGSVAPSYAGLVPGSVGLYQINALVPAVPSGVGACAPGVYSNLTITLIGLSSTDGASICVAP